MTFLVIWTAQVGTIAGNNVTSFDTEEDAKEFGEHLLKLNKRYSVTVCKVISYHVEEHK